MTYNIIFNGLDFTKPSTLFICLLLIIMFLYIGHKLLIPIYKKYLKKYVQGKPKNK